MDIAEKMATEYAKTQAQLDKVSGQLQARADTDKQQAETVGALRAEVQHLMQAEAKRSQDGTSLLVNDDSDSRPDATLRDQQGKSIGVMLSAKDLRSQARMRSHLGTLASHGSQDSEPMRLTEFVRGVAGMGTTQAVKAALSEGTNSAGGYAVPSVLLPGILQALAPASSLLQAGANVAVLDTQASSFKVAAVDTLPTAAWREEAGELAESDPTFRGIEIAPQSLAFIFKVSRELLADAPGMEDALSTAIAAAFAKRLDFTGLYGSGVAPTPGGLRSMGGVHVINNVGALTNYRAFVSAMRSIKEANAPAPTAAIVSTREDETIANFADTTGQPLRRPEALAGWQFIANSQIPTGEVSSSSSLTTSDAFVGDFTGFTFYMREIVSIQLLKELYAGTGEVGFACHVRADFAPAYPKAFAVLADIEGA